MSLITKYNINLLLFTIGAKVRMYSAVIIWIFVKEKDFIPVVTFAKYNCQYKDLKFKMQTQYNVNVPLGDEYQAMVGYFDLPM